MSEEKREIITILEQVNAKMEEQNEIIVGIMDVVGSHTRTINQLEEEIKSLEKSQNVNTKSPRQNIL